jgi:hypothetical protein
MVYKPKVHDQLYVYASFHLFVCLDVFAIVKIIGIHINDINNKCIKYQWNSLLYNLEQT